MNSHKETKPDLVLCQCFTKDYYLKTCRTSFCTLQLSRRLHIFDIGNVTYRVCVVCCLEFQREFFTNTGTGSYW